MKHLERLRKMIGLGVKLEWLERDPFQTDFEEILLDKLPDVLDDNQKRNKIKNNLQRLRIQGIISPIGKIWKMSNTDS